MTSFHLNSQLIRQNAIRAVKSAPEGWTVTVSLRKRSDRANAKMWAMLADVAKARPEGRQWVPETWKSAFLHALGHQVMFAEGLDGSGPFPIGFRSSKLNVAQMADLITVIQQYGDSHGVEWSETEKGGFMELQERAGE